MKQKFLADYNEIKALIDRQKAKGMKLGILFLMYKRYERIYQQYFSIKVSQHYLNTQLNMATYTCFTRSWYRYEYNTDTRKRELVPNPGARRTKMQTFKTEEAAREYCKQWNDSHNPGPTSRKCEYTSNY